MRARWIAAGTLVLCSFAQAEPAELHGPPEPESTVAAAEAVATALPEPREVGRGLASWYGKPFHGKRTASGERFDMHGLTAAHRSLPFGTVVEVHSLVNGRTVEVRVNDRGPFIRKRIIDLSRGAAEALGLIESGTGTKSVVLRVRAPAKSR